MNVTAWQRRVDRNWPGLIKEAERAAHAPPDASLVVISLRLDVMLAILVRPGDARRRFGSLAASIDRMVAYQTTAHDGRRIGAGMIPLVDMANALECAGCRIADATRDALRSWLPRLEVSQDDERVEKFWTTGFAALALDEGNTYLAVAGLLGKSLAFAPGQAFAHDVQALLGYLAGAIEHGGSLADVLPAWHDFLRHYDRISQSHAADESTLLWVARVVHHRIGKAALGEVAQRLHDDCWRLAP